MTARRGKQRGSFAVLRNELRKYGLSDREIDDIIKTMREKSYDMFKM